MPTVLIVDDEQFFLDSVVRGLSAALPGTAFLQASHGEQALEQIARQPVDVMVTDLNMPVMDGFQLLTQLVQREITPAIIVMTAFGTADIERELRNLGAIDYIEKPIDLPTLTNSIRRALEQRAGGYLRGINLAGFLQLLVIEQKSCRLVIRQGAQSGELYFEQGNLAHAVLNDLQGEAAAHAIVTWTNPEIALHPPAKNAPRTIRAPLDQLLLDAHHMLDERQRESREAPDSTVEDLFLEETPSAPSVPAKPPPAKEIRDMGNIKESLMAIMDIEGCIGAALADWKSGMCLGTIGGTPAFNLEMAATSNTEVVRAKMRAVANLNLKETIEDIFVTLDTQYHLIWFIKNAPNLFFYVAIRKGPGSLALARYKLSQIESELTL